MVLKEEEILCRNGKPPLFNCHLANAQDILFTPVYFWQSCGIAVQSLNACNTWFLTKSTCFHCEQRWCLSITFYHINICIGHNPQCSHAPRNEINASRRQREAAFEKGEADKMLKIKVLVLRDGAGAVAGDIPPLVGLMLGWLAVWYMCRCKGMCAPIDHDIGSSRKDPVFDVMTPTLVLLNTSSPRCGWEVTLK